MKFQAIFETPLRKIKAQISEDVSDADYEDMLEVFYRFGEASYVKFIDENGDLVMLYSDIIKNTILTIHTIEE